MSRTEVSTTSESPSRRRIEPAALVPAAVFVITLTLFASIGGSPGPIWGLVAVLSVALPGLLVVGLLHVAALGLGRLVPRPAGLASALGPRWALGLALLLVLMQVTGTVGLIGTGPAAIAAAWVPVLAGLALALADPRLHARFRRTTRIAPAPGRSVPAWIAALTIAAALAIVTVAASSPPGWLWPSEYRGFDALSYHLPIAQEWLAAGRVAPLDHAVYSALPSGMEVSFAWLATLSLAGPQGLLAGDGWRLMLTQFWHASFLLPLAWAVLAGTRSLIRRNPGRSPRLPGCAGQRAGSAPLLAAAAAVATPWAVVTGTLAYNDLAAAAFAAASVAIPLAARRVGTPLPAARLALCVALPLAAAALCKPTALFIAGPAVAAASLIALPPRSGQPWGGTLRAAAVFLAVGSLVGILALTPWLARNWHGTANPLFPFAAQLFGTGHWSEAQAARWSAAHTTNGGFIKSLAMLAMPDPDAGDASPAVVRWRGATNPQWGLLWLVAAASFIWCAVARRWSAALLGLGVLAGILLWALITHVQSRFLLPLIGPVCILVGVAAAARPPRSHVPVPPALWLAPAAGLPVVQFLALVVFFLAAGSPPGSPNAALLGAVPLMRGEFDSEPGAGPATMTAAVRALIDPGESLYLLGDARPLYYAPGGRPLGPANITWHTVWDAGDLDAIRTRLARADWIAVDYNELFRYMINGYVDSGVDPASVKALVESIAEPRAAFAEGRIVLYERVRSLPPPGS